MGEMCSELRENLIVSVGSPMIDMVSRVDNTFLAKYHLLENGAVLANETHKELFHELEKIGAKAQIGGSTTRTVRILQRSLKFPKASCFIGAIGDDTCGKVIENRLEEENINFLFERIRSSPTDRCAVLLTNNDRSLVTDLGASKCLDEEILLRENIREAIEKAEYFYMSAFFMGVSYKIMTDIGQYSQEHDKTLILNLGASFLCSKYKKQFKQFLPYVKILIGNEDEARSLAKVFDVIDEDISKIALGLNRLHRTTVIITRGHKPVVVSEDGNVFELDVPMVRENGKLNTNGAGDCFVGGFLAAYVQRKSIKDCVECGISTARDFLQNCEFKSDI